MINRVKSVQGSSRQLREAAATGDITARISVKDIAITAAVAAAAGAIVNKLVDVVWDSATKKEVATLTTAAPSPTVAAAPEPAAIPAPASAPAVVAPQVQVQVVDSIPMKVDPPAPIPPAVEAKMEELKDLGKKEQELADALPERFDLPENWAQMSKPERKAWRKAHPAT